MIEYCIVASIDVQKLVNDVNKHINEGWVPQGGLSVRTINKYDAEMVQPMIKSEKNA